MASCPRQFGFNSLISSTTSGNMDLPGQDGVDKARHTWMATEMKRKAAVRMRYGLCFITRTSPLWNGTGFNIKAANGSERNMTTVQKRKSELMTPAAIMYASLCIIRHLRPSFGAAK